MNCFELLLLMVFLVPSCLVCVPLGNHAFGAPGLALGLLVGVAGGVALFLGAVWSMDRVSELVSPSKPLCRQGKCPARQYRLVELGMNGWVWECSCGGRYLQRDGRFDEVLPDGSVRPYMEYAGFCRGWRSANAGLPPDRDTQPRL